jgi:hypothetical protein
MAASTATHERCTQRPHRWAVAVPVVLLLLLSQATTHQIADDEGFRL